MSISDVNSVKQPRPTQIVDYGLSILDDLVWNLLSEAHKIILNPTPNFTTLPWETLKDKCDN